MLSNLKKKKKAEQDHKGGLHLQIMVMREMRHKPDDDKDSAAEPDSDKDDKPAKTGKTAKRAKLFGKGSY